MTTILDHHQKGRKRRDHNLNQTYRASRNSQSRINLKPEENFEVYTRIHTTHGDHARTNGDHIYSKLTCNARWDVERFLET